MVTLVFLVMCVACVYVAVYRPEWFWTAIVGSSTILEIVASALHQSPTSINAGPISARATDPALLGVLVGTIYHARRENRRKEGFQFLTHRPVGGILLAILAFMAFKIVFSVLFRSDDIMASRFVSHSAGGLIAAIGDMRDELLPLLPIVYAYAARKSRQLRRLGWPLVVLVGILLAKAAIGIALPGGISAGNTDTEARFIPSEDAITLTILGFLLLFLPVDRLSRGTTATLGFVALTVATLANHRSQWFALAAGMAVLLLVALLGPPIIRNPKLIRVGVAASTFAVASFAVLVFSGADSRQSPLLPDFMVKRLYAFTDPSRDPDAEWRQRLWRSRIEQVGADWPWGRPFGARPDTLLNGRWTNVPAHSAYISIYEIGGFTLCALVLLFWGRVLQIALLRLLRHRPGEALWPAAIVLTTTACSLAYGSAYLFPMLGPSLAVILVLQHRDQYV